MKKPNPAPPRAPPYFLCQHPHGGCADPAAYRGVNCGDSSPVKRRHENTNSCGKAYWDGRQVTCNCPAYDFPYRFGGGGCNGYHMAKNCFENRLSCMQCNRLHAGGCYVMNETESPFECPYVLDFCTYYQIKLS